MDGIFIFMFCPNALNVEILRISKNMDNMRVLTKALSVVLCATGNDARPKVLKPHLEVERPWQWKI